MMKKLSVVSVLFVCLLIPFFTPGSAQAYSQIVAFGDSLSDNGNSDGYGRGISSNGPVWLEYLAGYTGNTLTDMAYGAAQTNYHPYTSSPVLGFLWQIDHYATYETGGGADPNALYTVWIGGNDLLNINPFASPGDADHVDTVVTNAINNIVTGVGQLIGMGAEHILVMNMPDLGATPLNNGDSATQAAARALSEGFNLALSGYLGALPSIDELIVFDVLALMDLFTDPSSSTFDNTTHMLQTAGTTTDSYLFWDAIHPTTYAHDLIAQQVLGELGAVPVPGTFMLLGFGLIGIVGLKRRQ